VLTKVAEERRDRQAHCNPPGGDDRTEWNEMRQFAESATDRRSEEEACERQDQEEWRIAWELRGRLATL
jgi:hypothetical protein